MIHRFAAVCLLCGIAARSDAQNTPRDYPPLASLITLGRPQVSIGSEDEGPTLFGEITSVAIDGDFNIYILDRTNHFVRSFSRTGRFLGSAGRPGRGPGDLSTPTSLFHDGASRLYVFDHVNGIVVFETRNGIMTHRRSFGTEFRPTAACAFGDTLVVAAWRGDRILHVFTADGTPVRSFGEGFIRDTSEHVRAMANRMTLRVNCDRENNRIYATPNSAGVVRAYQTDGRLLWERELPDYRGAEFRAVAGGAMVISGRFSTSSVLRLGQDLLVVSVRHFELVRSSQVRQGGGRGSLEDREFVTYVLSARTGQLLTRGVGVPQLGVVRGDIAVGYEHDPFPRVFIMPWRETRR
jgi:outer membrane protein assembly factor BamB